jgi:hypothetical protein
MIKQNVIVVALFLFSTIFLVQGTFADSELIRLDDRRVPFPYSNGNYYQVNTTHHECEWWGACGVANSMSVHGSQGHLATITNAYEQFRVNQLRIGLGQDIHVWIGLRRDCSNCPWQWVTGENYDYSYWFGTEGDPFEIPMHEDLFGMMRTWGEETSGLWESAGNGNVVMAYPAIEFPNPPPVADAGQDQEVTCGTLVALNGGSSTDIDGDYPLTFSWEIVSIPDGSTAALDDPYSETPCFTPDVSGQYVVTLVVTDYFQASSDPDQVTITVTPVNDAPDAVDDSATTDEDTPVTVDVLANDSDVDEDTLSVMSVSDPGHGTATNNGDSTVTYTPDENYYGDDSFTYTIGDGKGGTGAATVTITVTAVNDAPDAVDDSATTDEDTPVTVDVLANDSDVDGDTLSVMSVSDPGHGTATNNGDSTVTYTPDENYYGDDSFTYTIGDGIETDTAMVTITVTPVNDAPVLGTIGAPVDPVMAGDSVLISAPFSDPDTDDTHSAMCSWGDDSPPEPCTVQKESGSGTVSCSHTYAVPGVYLVKVELSDNYGLTDIEEFAYIVIFDPEGGFVTGGGWITSPPGAYPADTTLSGKATFGFVSKYKKGAAVPTGETEFQFKLAGLNFHSESYQWLVVAGPRAQYKGTGQINGEGEYGFILTAIDGAISGGGGLDKFRIKIWDKQTESIVYDNQIDSDDTADPETVIGGGSIVIHKS